MKNYKYLVDEAEMYEDGDYAEEQEYFRGGKIKNKKTKVHDEFSKTKNKKTNKPHRISHEENEDQLNL